MRVVKDTVDVTIQYVKEDLLNGKYMSKLLLSKKLAQKETEDNTAYKSLRNRLYNTWASKKYNTKVIAGFECIDVKDPMRTDSVSLRLNFKEV